jgi:hypothetical protein
MSQFDCTSNQFDSLQCSQDGNCCPMLFLRWKSKKKSFVASRGEAEWVSGGIVSRILNLGIIWRWMSASRLGSFIRDGRPPGPTGLKAGRCKNVWEPSPIQLIPDDFSQGLKRKASRRNSYVNSPKYHGSFDAQMKNKCQDLIIWLYFVTYA